MPSPARILASLADADRAVRWTLEGNLGQIRSRRGGGEFYLDFRPYGRVWSNRGIRITDEETARRLLEQIRGKVADGKLLHEVLAEYLPANAKPNLVPSWMKRWLDVRRREAEAGTLSPYTFRQYQGYAKPGGHFSYFDRLSIHEITFGVLEDWSLWLADRGQNPKSRRNIISAFKAFLAWLRRRGEIREVPEFSLPRADEYEPRIMAIEEQDLALEAIPVRERGIFLAMARLGLRPGEARAMDATDYRDGWITVDKAMKGKGSGAPIGGTKTGKPKRLPVGEELAGWIEEHVPREARLSSAPLFANPRTGRRWNHQALTVIWKRALSACGLPHAPLYEGTKHSFATDAMRRDVPERLLQKFLGHADVRSTRRYARLADSALVRVLRPESDVATSWRQDSADQTRAKSRTSWWAARDSNPEPMG